MDDSRDMMYGGFCQNTPYNMAYGNFGYQLPPGALLNSNLLSTPLSNISNMQNNLYDNNPLIDINARLSNLENRVKTLEQNLNTNTSQYQDDNSLYMI